MCWHVLARPLNERVMGRSEWRIFFEFFPSKKFRFYSVVSKLFPQLSGISLGFAQFYTFFKRNFRCKSKCHHMLFHANAVVFRFRHISKSVAGNFALRNLYVRRALRKITLLEQFTSSFKDLIVNRKVLSIILQYVSTLFIHLPSDNLSSFIFPLSFVQQPIVMKALMKRLSS